MSHHHANHHSHAHFDEHGDENHSHSPRFEEGYANNQFSTEGYSNERFNADALQEDDLDDDPCHFQENETANFCDDDYSHDPEHHHRASYGHAFAHEGADQYFSHEHHGHPHHQFSHSHPGEVSHEHHRSFSDVVPSKTLFERAFSHSGSASYSQTQTAEFDEEDQISNDLSEEQMYPINNAPPRDVLHETMSTQTFETKKPHKGNHMMQKCRIISDVTKNYFAECCLNRKHEIPTRDYGSIPAPRCMDIPMTVNEIQNRHNFLRMYSKQGPVEVHCYNSNVYKQEHPVEEIHKNEDLSYSADEFPEVNACHNINNFNDDYPNPNGSLNSFESLSVCVDPTGPEQPISLKSCLCKKQPNGSFCGNQMTGSLRGGAPEGKKVRMSSCSYKKPPVDPAMQDSPYRGGRSKPCSCRSTINAKRSNLSSIASVSNGGCDGGSERGNYKNVRTNPCMYKRPPPIREVDEIESRQNVRSERSNNSGRSGRGNSKLCECKDLINGSFRSGLSSNRVDPLEVDSRGYGSNTSLHEFDGAYRLSHNLDNKKTSCTLCNCAGSSNGIVGNGGKTLSNAGIEIHINTGCACKTNDSAGKKDQSDGCNLCCCSETEKRGNRKSQSDLYYLCKKEVTKTSGLIPHSSEYVATGSNGRSRSHGDLYCLCSAKKSTTSSRASCCCKNSKCGRAKSNNDLLRHCCTKETKPNKSTCGCCCQKNAALKTQHESSKNKCKCCCSNVTISKSTTSEASTSESDTESQKCCCKNKKKPHMCLSCKKKEEKGKQSCCLNAKNPFQIEFDDDDDDADNPIPIFKVCLCRKSQVNTKNNSNDPKDLTVLTQTSFEPINRNPSAMTGTDDSFYKNQNKINNYLNAMTETDDNQTNNSSIGSKNNPSILIGTDDIRKDSWIGSSGGVHGLTATNCNSFNNSVCTSTNILAKDKSMQSISRKFDEIIENEDDLPIIICNRKCSLLDQDLYEGPFEVETCNPFYITESQLRVHYNGSEVNILYASSLVADGCNQKNSTRDYSCTASLGLASDRSSTTDSLTVNEISVPVLRDQEIQVAQTKHKTKINIVNSKRSKAKLKRDCGVCKQNKKIYCCDPPGTEVLSSCLEKLRLQCKCSEEEDESRDETCTCGQCKVREMKPKTKRKEEKYRDLSEEVVRKTKCKCSTEHSDEVFQEVRKRSKEEKKAPCGGSTRKKCNYVVVNSKGEVQSETGPSRQVRKSSSVELYCAFLKRAEVVFLACSMIFYVFIYKMLTSYAL